MRRAGLVRKCRWLPVEAQRDTLEAFGCTVIYTDVDDALKALRADAPLYVAESLRVLGDNRDAIRGAIAEAHNRGSDVAVLRRGDDGQAEAHLVGPGAGAQLMADAVAELAMERRRGINPSEAARRRWAKHRRKRMDEAEARAIWFNRALKEHDALERMAGWKRTTAFRTFGPRSGGDSAV